MKGVAAGFGDDVHERARHTTKLDIRVGTEKAEFLDGIGIRRCAALIAPNVVVETAIDKAGIRGCATCIDHEGAVVTRGHNLIVNA